MLIFTNYPYVIAQGKLDKHKGDRLSIYLCFLAANCFFLGDLAHTQFMNYLSTQTKVDFFFSLPRNLFAHIA
jgi:hypothetical protein